MTQAETELAALRNHTLDEAAMVAESHCAGHAKLFATQRSVNYEHAGRRIAQSIRALKSPAKE